MYLFFLVSDFILPLSRFLILRGIFCYDWRNVNLVGWFFLWKWPIRSQNFHVFFMKLNFFVKSRGMQIWQSRRKHSARSPRSFCSKSAKAFSLWQTVFSDKWISSFTSLPTFLRWKLKSYSRKDGKNRSFWKFRFLPRSSSRHPQCRFENPSKIILIKVREKLKKWNPLQKKFLPKKFRDNYIEILTTLPRCLRLKVKEKYTQKKLFMFYNYFKLSPWIRKMQFWLPCFGFLAQIKKIIC